MIPLLAAEVDNNVLMGGMVGTFALLFGLYLKVRAWEKSVRGEGEKREIGPQPFEVRMHDVPLTLGGHREICGPLIRRVGALENDVRMIRLKMEADKTEIISAGEERAKDMHRRIDNLPHQIIALLKDTKGLIG